jgi:hypothetical protein
MIRTAVNPTSIGGGSGFAPGVGNIVEFPEGLFLVGLKSMTLAIDLDAPFTTSFSVARLVWAGAC